MDKEAFRIALKGLDLDVRAAERKLLEIKGQRKKFILEALMADPKTAGIPSSQILPGTWDCSTSPTGFCAYNRALDPCLDDCLFCGDPDERK